MKILLVGEYSRLHNSLKEGLTALGHEVKIVACGDGFKKFPVDEYINHSFHSFLLRKLKVFIYRLTAFDLGSLEIYLKFLLKRKKFKNFDIVQLINQSPFGLTPYFEKKIIRYLIKHNKKKFLLSCGEDYLNVQYMLDHKLRYSVLTPYLKDTSLKNQYIHVLRYSKKQYKDLYNFMVSKFSGVIASDMDYHIPLVNKSFYSGLIPNPINVDKIKYEPLSIDKKVKLFYGVNSNSKLKKGHDYFMEALNIISEKYSESIEIKTTINLPYNEYVKHLSDCHILLDQVLSFDQGYNALEAMAMGKVVLTGAEKEFEDHYNLTYAVAINVTPDVDQIVDRLSDLIENPEKIIEISKNARAFIEKEHHYLNIAKKYLKTWEHN